MKSRHNPSRDSGYKRELRDLDRQVNKLADGYSGPVEYDPRTCLLPLADKLDKDEVRALNCSLWALVKHREEVASKAAVEAARREEIPAARRSAIQDARKTVLEAFVRLSAAAHITGTAGEFRPRAPSHPAPGTRLGGTSSRSS
jgi:hypothetical protein